MHNTHSLQFLCTLLLVGLVSVSHAADKPVHLFVLSGQSNMAGMDPKTGLVPEAESIFPEATVAVLKVARGGEPIRRWLSEWPDIARRNGLEPKGPPQVRYYQPILDRYRQLLQKHQSFSSVTFCWMQGERDARESLGAAYADALKTLIAQLRKDLKQPKMNVVIGRISDFKSPAYPHWDRVRKAQMDVATQDARGAWVDCDDLNNLTRNGKPYDDLHYTKDGYELLGRRFARQAKALIEGTNPDPKGRP